MTRTLLRIATLALTLGALAAPNAFARPAGPAPAHVLRAAGFPARPVLDRSPVSVSSAAAAVLPAPADHGADWTTLGLGIAGGLLGVGAAAVLVVRRRDPSRARVAA
jgi:hypothetical protein